MTRRVGIYAGSFAPVHKGHIAFCLAALIQCGLDEILLVPEPSPRTKPEVMPLKKRISYLQKAIADHPNLRVIELDEVYFSVATTLPKLQEVTNNAELTLLLGSDIMRSVMGWTDATSLVRQVSFAVGLRRHDTIFEVNKIAKQLEQNSGLPVQLTVVSGPHRFMSSSFLQKLGYLACAEAIDFST